jgi:hypothetical protein
VTVALSQIFANHSPAAIAFTACPGPLESSHPAIRASDPESAIANLYDMSMNSHLILKEVYRNLSYILSSGRTQLVLLVVPPPYFLMPLLLALRTYAFVTPVELEQVQVVGVVEYAFAGDTFVGVGLGI